MPDSHPTAQCVSDQAKTDATQAASSTRKRTEGKRSALGSALSGAASGAMVSLCLQPFDVLRTRMQVRIA
eukprot:6172429-Pleurochrysis_carterae.AAC.1